MLEYCFYYFKPNLVWECFSSLHCTKKAKTNIVEAGPHGKVQGSRNSNNKIELIDKRDSQLLTKQFLSTIIQASSSICHKCSVHNHLGWSNDKNLELRGLLFIVSGSSSMIAHMMTTGGLHGR